MFDAANPVTIFLPMLVVVFWTFLAFVRMAAARGKVMKEGAVDGAFYRAHQGGQEPEYAVVAVRHYGNLFELPTVFYAGCLTAYVLEAVSFWLLVFAWAFVALRLVQSAVHLTTNNPGHRGIAFVLSMIAMIALWVNLALVIAGRV